MTSQPPPPPGGPGQPGPGEQPPQQPWGQQPPPAQQPWGQQPAGQPAGSGGTGISFDRRRLTMASYAIAGLTLLYLILSFFTWYGFGAAEFFGVELSISGWTDGQVKLSFFLFLLAAVWAALPAFTEVRLGFPRSWITVGLAALGFVLTLFVWIDTLDLDFSIWALLGLLTAAAILGVAVLSLLPELRGEAALPGALGGAAQWANGPGPGSGPAGPQQQAYPQQPPPPHGGPGTPPQAPPGQPGGPV